MAAKVASSQSGIVKRNNNNAADLSTLSTEEDISGNQIKLETIESGKISYLEPGEDIIFPNGPSRPSGAFIEFHKVLMRNICLGLGIPYSFAVDPSAMSGPTARLEMQQAGRTFKRYQNLLNDKVLRPIKNIVIADAVARGMIQTNEGGKTTRGIFNFGANVSIDLGRESASAIAEFKSGLRTGSDIYAERGADWEASMRQRAIEAKAIQDLAKEYGVPPETISDVVPPEKPVPAAPAPRPQPAPKPDEDEQDDGEEPDNAPEPDEPIEPSSENLEVKKKESENPLEFLNPAELKMLIAGMMGGIELGKYDGIDFTPPQGAMDAAKRALDVREGKPASQKGMTPVGIARARDLMNGVKLSPDTVRRMKAFFDRHEVDKKGATWDEKGKGWQAWNGWGGDAGYAWARKVVGQMESRDKELSTNQKDVVEFLRGRDCGQDDGGTFGPGNDCATGYGRPKQEGGYTPMRPGGKWPSGYKVGEGRTEERKKSTEQGKPRQEKPKEEKPSPEANEPMKGENLKPREWAKQIKANKEDKKLFEDFTGSRFREINRNPEGEESQRLVSLVDKQAPQKQEQEMYRGLTLKSDAEAEAFIDKLRGGTKLDRTLTSFTPDANKAVFFAYSKVQEPTSVFMVLKNSQNLRSIKDVSVEGTSEKEFVLTRGKRLRLIGEPKYKKDVYAKGANEFIIEVEEY
jgi:hypothetical protein